jgi:hypothetical protein
MMLQAQHREIVDRVMCRILVNVVYLNGQSRRVAHTTGPVMLEHDLRRNVVRDWRSGLGHFEVDDRLRQSKRVRITSGS